MATPPRSVRQTSGSQRGARIDADPEELVGLLGDEDCRRIFQAAMEPVSVPDLVEELDLPVSTTYRKVAELHDVGLLTEVDPGNTSAPARYLRSVRGVTITVDDGLEVDVSEHDPFTRKLVQD